MAWAELGRGFARGNWGFHHEFHEFHGDLTKHDEFHGDLKVGQVGQVGHGWTGWTWLDRLDMVGQVGHGWTGWTWLDRLDNIGSKITVPSSRGAILHWMW